MNELIDAAERFSSPPAAEIRRSLARALWSKLVAERATALAMFDQAFYSGTTFATSVLIGRLAGADVLGAYSLAFSLSVLVLCAHETLVTMPLTIFVHRLNHLRRRCASGSALVLYAAISLCAVIGFLAAAASVVLLGRNASLAAALLALAGAVPFMLLRELARKLAFAHLELARATLLDAAASILQISLLLLWAWLGRLTAISALMAVGLASGVAGGAWVMVHRRQFALRAKQIAADAAQHWRLGRWIFAALITLMMQSSLLMWLIALQLDTAASGIFAASLSVIALSNPLVNAIGGIFTPQACRALHAGGRGEVRRIALQKTLLLGAAAGVFALLVMALGDRFVALMFGAEYAGHAGMTAMLAVVALAKGLEIIAYNGLYVVERARVNLLINFAGLVALALFAPLAIYLWNLNGAALALLVVTATSSAARWCAFLRIVKP